MAVSAKWDNDCRDRYQTEHFSVGFIGEPTGQLKDSAKSFELESVPKILNELENREIVKFSRVWNYIT